MRSWRWSPSRRPCIALVLPAGPGLAVPKAIRMNLSVSRVIYRCLSVNLIEIMRNQRYVQIVVWVIVVGMVFGLAFAAISLF